MKDNPKGIFLKVMLWCSIIINPLCIAFAIIFYEVTIGHFLFMVAIAILICMAVFCAMKEKCYNVFSFKELKINGKGFMETWLFLLVAIFFTSLPFITTH